MSLSFFPFYPGDYLRDTRELTAEQHGVYLLLLMQQFNRGPLPDDLALLQQICGNASSNAISYVLDQYWKQDGEGRWFNPRMEKIRLDAEEKHQKRVDAGRKGGKAKSSNAKAMLKQCSSNQNQNQNHIKEKVNKKKFVPPTVEDVEQYAQDFSQQQKDKGKRWPTAPVNWDSFINHYQANGWTIGKSPMKDWKAAVRGWGDRAKQYSDSSSPADSPYRAIGRPA